MIFLKNGQKDEKMLYFLVKNTTNFGLRLDKCVFLMYNVMAILKNKKYYIHFGGKRNEPY